MNKLKKALAVLLTGVMLLGVVGISANAALAPDMVGHRYEEAAETLAALGIMVGDAETGLFRPEDAIKRSEVAKIAVNALGLADVAESANYQTQYPDVVSNHWANGFINVATQQGIVIGDDTGTFRPDDTITYAEAITILVRIVGHERVALSKGGYPAGFLVTAADLGITKNAQGSSNSDANRSLVAQMTFNALTVKMMEQTGFGQDPEWSVVDKTLLESKLHTQKLTGQVVATSQTKLNGSGTLKSDEVQIGNEIYKLADIDATNMLGYNVVFYLQEDNNGDNKVILIRPEANKNDSLTISADNFESIVDGTDKKVVSYWKDKDNDKRATEVDVIANPTLIYNGKTEAMDNALVNLKDKAGNVNLLDTDRDGKYDIIFVTEYTNTVVEEVMPSSGKIIDKYGAATITLDPEDEDLDYAIAMGNEKLDVKDLKEWDVLSVAASKDKSIYRILVTRENVTGKVTELDDEDIYIDGVAYEIANNYTNDIALEDEGTFYLDIEGKIAAIDTTSQISSNYAYLINAAMSGGISDTLELKVFTKDGETTTLTVADKVRLNGVSNKTGAEVLAALKSNGTVVNQLITFEKNSDNKISAIHTAKDNTATGAVDKYNFTKNLALDGAVYKSATGKVGNVNVNSSTIIFDIPEGSIDSDEFAIRNGQMFENDTPYDAIVFDMTEDFTAKVMIVTNTNYQANAESSSAIVTAVSTTKNDKDVIVDKLYAVQDGKAIEILANDRNVLVKDGGVALQKGDIIQYKKNSNDEISTIRVLFDISKKDTQFTATPATDLSISYGKVVAKFSGSMNMQVNDGSVTNVAFGNAKIYYLDASKSNNPVIAATSGDIQKFDSSDPSMVFVKSYKDVVEEIIIVKL